MSYAWLLEGRMSLSFISAGINFDFTELGLKELNGCEEIYAEIYTSPIPKEEIHKLEKKIGKKIELIERGEVESNFLIEKAKQRKIGLIVVGDALIATTHISLLIECKKSKTNAKIIHNSSIISAAIGKSGLQTYRFGKSATLPYWKKNYEPTSSLEAVEENLKRNLHTLLFLDVDKELGPMDAKKGIEMIGQIQEKIKKNIVKKLIVLSRVGYEDERISFGSLDELNKKNLGKPLVIFVVPAKLHVVEEEYVKLFTI